MRVLLCLLFALFATSGFSQVNGIEHGTIIIAAIADDGIVIASDSRLSLFDLSATQVGYRDSVQKIFIINGTPIAIGGWQSCGEKYWPSIIKNFQSLTRKSESELGYATVKSFTDYYKNNVRKPCCPTSNLNMFISGYYENNTPWVTLSSISDDTIYRINEGFACNEKMDLGQLPAQVNYQLLANRIEKSINDYVAQNNASNGIGGVITIYVVLPDNSIKLIKRGFSAKQITTITSLKRSIKRDKLSIKYLVPNGKKLILNTITERQKEFTPCN